MDVAIGTRIYYTGDLANQSSWGTLSEIKRGRFGEQVCVLLDTGRACWVPPAMIGNVYHGTCNPRFVTEAAYNAWRDERLAAYKIV